MAMSLPLFSLMIALPALQASAPASDAQAVLDAARAKYAAVLEARAAFLKSGKNRKDFKPDCTRELLELDARLAQETRPEVRQALLVSRFFHLILAREFPSDAALAQIRKEVSATSAAWSLNPAMLADRGEEDPKAWGPYVAEARAHHPDPAVRSVLLFQYFWERLEAKDEAAWKPAYQTLQTQFADSRQAKQAKGIFEAEQKTPIGGLAPAFSLPALGEGKATYTLEGFKGRFLLIDFWATWCGPCRAEMPTMHAAWARFKGKPFDILSLSFDNRVDHIAPFRAQAATPMPWKHAFIEGGFDSPVAAAYGVKGIPKPLLIGPDGKIVASGADLRGENLERTLAKFLGN
jgi:thiol-disulfide isomerase/thioredoxin